MLPKRSQAKCSGFTLVEMLVVIAIVSLLAGLIMPALMGAKTKGKIAKCNNNLRQIHTSIVMYKDERYFVHNRRYVYPGRLFTLVEEREYIQDPDVFLCPLDGSHGAEGGKPSGSLSQYPELDEMSLGLRHSYMYEFSSAKCSWGWTWSGPEDEFAVGCASGYAEDVTDLTYMHPPNNEASWGEVKESQQKFGDTYLDSQMGGLQSYDETLFPVLRCFWHMRKPDDKYEPNVSNVAMAGHVFKSYPQWEFTALGLRPPP